jgi:hypothetical protein
MRFLGVQALAFRLVRSTLNPIIYNAQSQF